MYSTTQSSYFPKIATRGGAKNFSSALQEQLSQKMGNANHILVWLSISGEKKKDLLLISQPEKKIGIIKSFRDLPVRQYTSVLILVNQVVSSL